MTSTVMISTRDRVRDLERSCERVADLKPPPDEVIIYADGCRDETTRMVGSKFPSFKLLSQERPTGGIVCRDRMLRIARGDIVVSLDDDSYPVERNFLERLPAVFSEHPEAAVVVFPELRDGKEFSDTRKTSSCPGHYVSAYANCAAAMRRDLYLRLPGFSLFFTHMYEEPDYAVQCYTAGNAIWFEPSLTVRHHVSAVNRVPLVRHQLNARNELWSVWLRCPWPLLPLVSVYRMARQFVYATSEGMQWAAREPGWWWAALKGAPQCHRLRRPASCHTYIHWMRLAQNPIYTLEEFRRRFALSPRIVRCPHRSGLQ